MKIQNLVDMVTLKRENPVYLFSFIIVRNCVEMSQEKLCKCHTIQKNVLNSDRHFPFAEGRICQLSRILLDQSMSEAVTSQEYPEDEVLT